MTRKTTQEVLPEAGRTLDVAQSAEVTGGESIDIQPLGEMNMTPLYDALVDATSQFIERVITAAKQY